MSQRPLEKQKRKRQEDNAEDAKRQKDESANSSMPAAEAEAERLKELRRKRQAKLQAIKAESEVAAAEVVEAPSAERQPTTLAAAAEAGTAGASPSSDGAAAPTREALPDEADGQEAAYFDEEEEANVDEADAADVADGSRPTANGRGERPRGEASGASRHGGTVNGSRAASEPTQPGGGGGAIASRACGEGGGSTMPSSADSTVEPGERADALDVYMVQIEAQHGALALPAAASNSRCVLLEQILTAAAAADAEEVHATRMCTGHECSRWGSLLRVHAVAAFDANAEPVPGRIAGRVFVEFEAAQAAAECARAMDGRFFDGRRVSATFYPAEAFLAGDFARAGAEVQQNAITWEDIVSMNSRPASSWDTMTGVGAPSGGVSADAATEPMQVDASGGADATAGGDGGGSVVSGDYEDDEPSHFHEEFMKQMRAHAAESARQAAHASAELLEGNDDAMDALVEEFPNAAENVAAPSESDDDDAAREECMMAARAKKKELAKVDHALVSYAPFRKDFYIEVPEIKSMSDEAVDAMRKELDSMKVRGKRVPRPIRRWAQVGLSDRLLGAIDRSGYAKPFPIQAQTLPAVMSGRDVIAIAKTGSGKTMGYTLPLFRHAMDQPPLAAGDGPIGLIMVPTRELCATLHRTRHRLGCPVL